MIFVDKKRSTSAFLFVICALSLAFGEVRCADNLPDNNAGVFLKYLAGAAVALIGAAKAKDTIQEGYATVKSDGVVIGNDFNASYKEKKEALLKDLEKLSQDITTKVFEDVQAKMLGDNSLEDILAKKLRTISEHKNTHEAITNVGWVCGKTAIPIAFATITIFFASKYFWDYSYQLLQKPRVVSEYYKQGWFSGKKKSVSAKMVFPKLLKERLGELIEEVKAVRIAIRSGAKKIKFRNIVLYGHPGTGNTMWAKQFAYKSGMDFAFISGASLLQKGAGIQAVQELFAWAKKSKNGLCLFVDRADALFVDHKKMDQSSENYATISYLLSELGQASDTFVVVATTNYLATFDEAMERRFEVAVEVPLPGFEERIATLKLYRSTTLLSSANSDRYLKKTKRVMTDAKINSIAQITDGFCYDDLCKIINGIRVSPRAKNGPTEEVIDQIVQDYVAKKAAFARLK